MQHSLKKEEFNFNKNSWSLNYEYFKIEINEDDFKKYIWLFLYHDVEEIIGAKIIKMRFLWMNY